MNNGLCDVKGCQNLPLLGWRPLTEHRGRKICEQHWRRHQDENDRFDLYVEFKFRRPEGYISQQQRSTFLVVLVDENFSPGIGSVQYARKNRNVSGKSEPITSVRNRSPS